MNILDELQPRSDDLVVVPEGMDVPEGVPFHVYKMKFLHAPSIIRSGGYSMSLLDKFTSSSLSQLLGIKPTDKVRGAQVPIIPPATNDERVVEPIAWLFPTSESQWVHHDEDEPPAGEMLADKPPRTVEEFVQIYEAASLGLNPDLDTEGRPSDVAKTDLPRFWRYERPTLATETMSGPKIVVQPKGGAGFYIELDAANKTFAFSYALCHNNDNFNYALARQITKGRFDGGDWYEVRNYDEKVGVVENISIALTNFLYNRNVDETKDIVFSSTPDDRVSLTELKELLQRI